MPRKRTTSASELLIPLLEERGQSFRAQLEDRLRTGIRGGVLRPGSSLPATRVLAHDLGLSRGVVIEAYAQLTAEGYLTAVPGSGTRVALGAQAGVMAAPIPASSPRIRYDFRPGVPDTALFPRSAWITAWRHAARTAPDSAFGYGDPRGAPELRAALAAYLARVRGVAVEAGNIITCTGFAQALTLVCRVLRSAGIDHLALEDPAHPGQRDLIAHAGLQLLPIPVDGDGLRVDVLQRSEARALLVTPAHQFPLGVVLAPERRAALARWARERRAVVVEDDYDAEHRYDRAPIGAFQGLAPDQVVYAGSASKTLAPGLRLGWMVAPASLLEALSEAKHFADLGSPILEQLAFADFLETGGLDRHLRRVRLLYRDRRNTLVRSLAAHAPFVQVRGVSAGLHAVAELPAGADEQAVVEAARELGVGVYGMRSFYALDGDRPPALVLGYAALSEPAIEAGIALLARCL